MSLPYCRYIRVWKAQRKVINMPGILVKFSTFEVEKKSLKNFECVDIARKQTIYGRIKVCRDQCAFCFFGCTWSCEKNYLFQFILVKLYCACSQNKNVSPKLCLNWTCVKYVHSDYYHGKKVYETKRINKRIAMTIWQSNSFVSLPEAVMNYLFTKLVE